MNGKGDKWRGGWTKEYSDNHNKIFGGDMVKDSKGRSLTVGNRVRIQEDIPSPDGMLYANTIVKLDEFNKKLNKIRVTDRTGKVWWIEPTQVSCSFL